jgi:hypothetical protein
MNAKPSFSRVGERTDRVMTAVVNAAWRDAQEINGIIDNADALRPGRDARYDKMRTRLADELIYQEVMPMPQDRFEAVVEAAIKLANEMTSTICAIEL